MIRCVRIWTGSNGDSEFEEGTLALPKGGPGDLIGAAAAATSVSFRETEPGHALEWHDAPAHQLVITMSGTLEFQVRSGTSFMIHPGDVLLAEDCTGSGHVWRLIGEDPWRRAYVIVPEHASLGFTPTCSSKRTAHDR